MNYYTIPKNNLDIHINIKEDKDTVLVPIISHSVVYFLKDMFRQLNNIVDDVTVQTIKQLVNTLEFVHTNIPGTSVSISKLKMDSNIFYEWLEICSFFNILEFKKESSITNTNNILVFSDALCSSNELFHIFGKTLDKCIQEYDFEKTYDQFIRQTTYDKKVDVLICAFKPDDYKDTTRYIKSLLLVVMIIIKYQEKNGVCLIKINAIYYKPVIDILLIFSAMFDKVYLVKPSITNILTGDKYLLCKGFEGIKNKNKNKDNIFSPFVFDTLLSSSIITNILENDISYYLLNKLEECNLLWGQQQIDALTQVLHIYNNKNKIEKMETMRYQHLQYCLQWCEKYKVPCNKLNEKTNIFLL